MRHLKNFSLFTLVGGVFYLVAIAANGLLIERLGLPTFWAAAGSLCVLFVLKYYASLWIGIVHPAFIRYTLSNILMSLLSAVMIWVSVDWWNLHAALSTGIVLGVVFVLRWLVLAALGVLDFGQEPSLDSSTRFNTRPTVTGHDNIVL